MAETDRFCPLKMLRKRTLVSTLVWWEMSTAVHHRVHGFPWVISTNQNAYMLNLHLIFIQPLLLTRRCEGRSYPRRELLYPNSWHFKWSSGCCSYRYCSYCWLLHSQTAQVNQLAYLLFGTNLFLKTIFSISLERIQKLPLTKLNNILFVLRE